MHTHTCIHAETAHTNTCTPKHTYTRARTQHAARIFTPAVGAEGNGVYGLGVAAQRVHTSALLHIPQLHGGVKGGGGQQQREMGVGRVGARGTPPVVGTCTGCRQWAHARVAGNGRMHGLQAMGACTGCRQWAHARVAGNGHMQGLQAMGTCTGCRQWARARAAGKCWATIKCREHRKMREPTLATVSPHRCLSHPASTLLLACQAGYYC